MGGLGDVVTALGRAVQEQGHLVEVILPRCVCGRGDECVTRMGVGGGILTTDSNCGSSSSSSSSIVCWGIGAMLY